MPQLLGSFSGHVGRVPPPSADTTPEWLALALLLVLETVLAPNPLRANTRTNPRINKASMGESPFAGVRPQFACCVKLSTRRLRNVPVMACEALLAVASGTKSSSAVLGLAGSGRAPTAMVSMVRD